MTIRMMKTLFQRTWPLLFVAIGFTNRKFWCTVPTEITKPTITASSCRGSSDWRSIQRERGEMASFAFWNKTSVKIARLPRMIPYVHKKIEGYDYYLKLLLRTITSPDFANPFPEPFVSENGLRSNGGCDSKDPQCILTWDGWARALATADVLFVDILQKSVPGAVVEVGVFRGGISAYLQGLLLLTGEAARRDMWLVDSFKGLPPKELMQSKAAISAGIDNKLNSDKDQAQWSGKLSAGAELVRNYFERLGLLGADNVLFLEGWIQDTLPSWNLTEIAFLRIDVDIYSATYDALNFLYPCLSRGGAVLFDDWKLPYSREAIEDYRRKHSISTAIMFLPGCVDPLAYWIKE